MLDAELIMATNEPMMSSPSPQPDLARNRLPTLFEVLSRRTLPPVDLFSFYIYMRDQQRSVDYLDFWWVVDDDMDKEPPDVNQLAGSMSLNTCHYVAITCANSDVPSSLERLT